MIKIERIYNNPRGNKSFRILVDRLWPRGLSKDKVKMDLWQKDIAPSNSLRGFQMIANDCESNGNISKI